MTRTVGASGGAGIDVMGARAFGQLRRDNSESLRVAWGGLTLWARLRLGWMDGGDTLTVARLRAGSTQTRNVRLGSETADRSRADAGTQCARRPGGSPPCVDELSRSSDSEEALTQLLRPLMEGPGINNHKHGAEVKDDMTE